MSGVNVVLTLNTIKCSVLAVKLLSVSQYIPFFEIHSASKLYGIMLRRRRMKARKDSNLARTRELVMIF